MSSRISIVIPVYKTPASLFAACMASVRSVSGDDLEIILVVDSPGDPIEKDVTEYAAKDGRIRVLRNDVNRGPAYSRNRGIAAAGGDYVMMVDADDVIVPNVCMRALQECVDNHLAYCAVARVYPWQKDGVDVVETHRLYMGSVSDVDSSLTVVVKRLDMSSCGVWYDRHYLQKQGLLYPEDIRQNEDFVFMTSILMSGARVGLWDEYGYQIICHAGSLSHTNNTSRFYVDQLTAACQIMRMVQKKIADAEILRFYAEHGYAEGFSVWHEGKRLVMEERPQLIQKIGEAARLYIQCYAVCLRWPALCVMRLIGVFPALSFSFYCGVNVVFRLLRRLGWFYAK